MYRLSTWPTRRNTEIKRTAVSFRVENLSYVVVKIWSLSKKGPLTTACRRMRGKRTWPGAVFIEMTSKVEHLFTTGGNLDSEIHSPGGKKLENPTSMTWNTFKQSIRNTIQMVLVRSDMLVHVCLSVFLCLVCLSVCSDDFICPRLPLRSYLRFNKTLTSVVYWIWKWDQAHDYTAFPTAAEGVWSMWKLMCVGEFACSAALDHLRVMD